MSMVELTYRVVGVRRVNKNKWEKVGGNRIDFKRRRKSDVATRVELWGVGG